MALFLFPVLNVSHGETHFIYAAKPKFILKGGVPCILPVAIIERLKVSCRTGPEATTMTAARTGRTRSAGGAGSISHTAEIGSAGM